MEIIVNSLKETFDLADKIASMMMGNEIILINGDLGAGKTTFTKAFALSLGVTDMVTSPTFAFMKEYYGRYKLSHYDMYRVECADELFELGISDNLYEEGIAVVEWNKFKEFPSEKNIININIEKFGECGRMFCIEGLTF